MYDVRHMTGPPKPTRPMTMLTSLDPEAADFNTVQEKLEAVGKDLGVQVIIQREDVFQYMYKI